MIKKLFKFIFKCILWLIVLSVAMVVLFKWVPVPITPLMVIRGVEEYQKGNKMTWEHDWVSIDDISKNLQLAVICSEDQNFLKHNGFDIKAIEKAIENNKKGKRIKGASTISQQTAKNVFLWPNRSWVRKGLETYFTFLIELTWSKERIMEVYLNSIEMGKGIYGAEAAARYWHNKSAAKLSAMEAASIAAILPNPLKYRAQPASNYIAGRKSWIVRQMGYFGRLDYNQTNEKKNAIKSELYNLCLLSLNHRLEAVQTKIAEIQESLTSETKSSAGDKHETGRAMLQLEREKAGVQLSEIQKQQNTLTKVKVLNTSKTICLGSVVYTSKSNYFVAISAGAFSIAGELFYAISPQTPIGKLLLGKTVLNEIAFNNQTIKIEAII